MSPQFEKRKKWAGPGLNRRHMDFQSIALPTELPARLSKTRDFIADGRLCKLLRSFERSGRWHLSVAADLDWLGRICDRWFRGPVAAQDVAGAAVIGDRLLIGRLIEPSGDREALGHVQRLRVGSMAVVFPKMHIGRFIALIQLPGNRADGIRE